MEQIKVDDYRPADAIEAADVLADAYKTNPIHIAVFQGRDEDLVARRVMYKVFLEHTTVRLLVARRQGRVVGVLGMAEWPGCQMTPEQAKALAPLLAPILGDSMPRYGQWRSYWAQQDPKEPHWHLGPIAVAPELQGRGIGKKMLEGFCARVDASQVSAYLETDRAENVPLYRQFGFAVVGEGEILGVKNWFMKRLART